MIAHYLSAHVATADLCLLQPSFMPQTSPSESTTCVTPGSLLALAPPFIHMHNLLGCISKVDFFSAQACMGCKQERGSSISCSLLRMMVQGHEHLHNTWGDSAVQMWRKFGKRFKFWEERARSARYADIVEIRHHWPTNGLPEDMVPRTSGGGLITAFG